MDYANEQHLTSNAPPVLELQQQYHFMAQLASHVRNESQQMLHDDNEAPNDYWGNGWSDEDELEENQHRESTTWTHQEHTNDNNDDDEDNYYAKWSEQLSPRTFGTKSPSTASPQQIENDLAALQELTHLLHQSLPCASTSVSALNPLPKAIQYRYEWDETRQ